MAKHIQGSIDRTEFKVKNGKLKIKRIKLKSNVSKKLNKRLKELVNDNINPFKRETICKNARDDMNPGSGAHSPVADMQRKISTQMRQDLGLD